MNLKRFKNFVNEGMYIDKHGRMRTDNDDSEGFKHSPRTERLLMYIEDLYDSPNTNKSKFDYMLNDRYALDRAASSIYTDLAMAIRDQIIPESDIENILDELEDEKYVTV